MNISPYAVARCGCFRCCPGAQAWSWCSAPPRRPRRLMPGPDAYGCWRPRHHLGWYLGSREGGGRGARRWWRCRDQLGVVCVGGQLQRGRVLHRQFRQPAGICHQRDERHLEERDGGGCGAQHPRGCRDQFGVVCIGGQLQRRWVLLGELRQPAGVCHQRDERHLEERDGGSRGPQSWQECPDRVGVVRVGGQLQCRRALPGPASIASRRLSSMRRAAPGGRRQR